VVRVELVLLAGLAVRCEARVRGVRAVRRRANLRGRGCWMGRDDVQSGHFRRRFRCVCGAEEERGVSVGPCGVHEGKRGSPMARGDAVARVAAWSERPAPPHHSLWAARRAQLIGSLLNRTVTNAHGLRDMSVHKPRRCQCALFYPSQILHSVISHQIIARNAPLACRSSLILSRPP
jgi:hypothetical protein